MNQEQGPGNVSEETRSFEDEDATVGAGADRMPTPDEAEAAPDNVDPKVAAAYEEAMKTGANVKGEGQIE